MPIVRIELMSGRSAQVKLRAARKVSEALSASLEIPIGEVTVVFKDIDYDDIAKGGEPVANRNKG